MAQKHERWRSAECSDLQLLREPGDHFGACPRDHNHVFDPNTAKAGIIKTRFYRHHFASIENHLLQSRIFMDLQSEPVAGPVEEPNPATFAHLGRETAV